MKLFLIVVLISILYSFAIPDPVLALQQPDTIKIKVPHYIETIIKENNWLYIFLSYIGGAISAIIIAISI